jgi:hypothetical protein
MSFWRGSFSRMAAVAPLSGVMFCVYEIVKLKMEKWRATR